MTTRGLVIGLAVASAAVSLWADSGTWTATTGGNWNDPANWDGGIIASNSGFTATLNAGTGTINNDMTDLALLGVQFAGGGYTLAGGTLTLDAAGFITVLADSHEVSAPLTLTGNTAVNVASARTLTLSGALSGAGGVTFKGGRVVLGNAGNSYAGGTVLVTGIVEIASVDALGDSSDDPANLVIGEGTLRYTGPSATLSRGYTIAPTNNGNRAAVIDVTDAGATLTVAGKAAAPGGSFIKTGDGTLAYTYPGYQELSKSRINLPEGTPLVFDANGSAGTNGYAIFTVDKGRVILGAAGQTNQIASVAWVGSRTLASPRLDIIGGVTRASGSYFTIGRGTGTLASPQQPSVYVSGGAYFEVPSFVMGYQNNQPTFYSEPYLQVDGATMQVNGDCYLSEHASLKSTVTVTNSGLFQCDSTAQDRGLSLSQTAGAQTYVNVGGGSTVRTYQLRLGRGGNLNVNQNSVFELDTMATNGVRFGYNLGTVRFNSATLKQRTALLASDWFVGVTNLLVGSGGLTVNVDSEAWLDALPQPDPDSPGGSITKTGAGTLVMRPGTMDVQVTGGSLALATELYERTNGLSATVSANASGTLELPAARGAADMTLDVAGAKLVLTPHSLASDTNRWAYNMHAMRRADGILQLTQESGYWNRIQNQKGSAFLVDKQMVAGPWTATFSYVCRALGTDPADGFAFVLHNDPRGARAYGAHGASLGYAGGTGEKITNSVAVGMNVTGHQIRFAKQGAFVDTRGLSASLPKLAVRPVKTDFTVSYDGAGLMTVVIDRPGAPVYTYTWSVDIAAEVGGSEAYVGFSAGTGGRQGQHCVADVSFDNGTAEPVGVLRPGGHIALGAGETLNAYGTTSALQDGYALQSLAYGDQSVVNVDTPATVTDPAAPSLLDRSMWKLSGKAFWKDIGRLAVSSNNNDSSGWAYTTNTFPVTGSWTATFDYDIGLISSPPADYITFAIQPGSSGATTATPSPGLAVMWRYYEGGVTTTSLRLYTNNAAVLATMDIAPVDLPDGGPASMTVSHDADAKTVTVITSQAAGAYTNVFTDVDMTAAMAGSQRAYVGFGAFTGGLFAENIVENFAFTWAKPAGAYLAFDRLSGSGTLIKRGTAALGLLGDVDRPTSGAAVRLEEGSLVLRKQSAEAVEGRMASSDWGFSPLTRWWDSDTLLACPYANSVSGTATSARRVRVTEAWTASFRFMWGRRSSAPADAVCMFFHNDPRGPAAVGGITGSAGYTGITKSIGLRWYFYPGNNTSLEDSTAIGRNGAWDEGSRQSHVPITLTNSVTDIVIKYDPTAATLTSIMTQGPYVITNTFTGVNIPTDVTDDYAYVGFGGGTGGQYGDMLIRNFRLTYDTPTDTQPDEVYLASLVLPDAAGGSVTLDSPVADGTFKIASATVGDGAALGVKTAGQPGTLVLEAVTQSGDAGYDVASGCTLTLTDLAGAGSLTKVGAGALGLAGAAATYDGDTVLAAGTLVLDAARLPTTTDLRITAGVTLNLDFSGKQHIHALFVDGVPMHGGQYTSSNTTWITGSGILVVTYPPVGTLISVK